MSNDGSHSPTAHKHRILILGGGFAGVHVAQHLERLLTPGEQHEIEVVLVSNENYMVFQPLLPEMVGATIAPQHGVIPIRRILRTTRVYIREIQSIDLTAKTVELAPGFQPHTKTLEFDQLVVCLGSRLDFSKVQGMKEHAI